MPFERFVNAALAPAAILLLLVCGAVFSAVLRPFRLLRSPKTLFCGEARSSLCTALAGTVGVGNIAGVTLAIAAGGGGALFWMFVSSLLAAAVKYTEILLACDARVPHGDGFCGGFLLVVRRSFGRLPAGLGAVVFLATAFTVGGAVQSSAVADAFRDALSVPPTHTGAMLVLAVALCIFGGNRRIARVAEWLVPCMTALYCFFSFYILIAERAALPSVLRGILQSAFSFRAAGGGALGVLLSPALRYGVVRGLISNEAGCGTAPFAYAATRADSASLGAVGLVEVLVDTPFLCTLTGLSLLVAYRGTVVAEGSGIAAVLSMYRIYFGGAAPIILAIAVFLFAYGSIVAWAFYGIECLSLLGMPSGVSTVFRVVFLLSVFAGTFARRETLWAFSDLSCYLLLLINLPALLRSVKRAKALTDAAIRKRQER